MTPHEAHGPSEAHGPPDPQLAPPDLLLADPDPDLARDVAARFLAAGVRTLVCHDGAEALLQVGARRPRAVLLAAPLPLVGAAAVTELIARLHPVPVIVGAGAEGAAEATAALSAGAVAFVARPYRAEEILPLLRGDRGDRGDRTAGDAPRMLVVGDIELDAEGFHVYVRGRSLTLPVREFLLLRYLMERPNKVVSRRELTKALWGVDKLDSNTLTVHVRRVRNKLRDEAGSRCTIDAIRGMGYRLECGREDAAASDRAGVKVNRG
ncbi:putative response regulator [Streptomyces davaonensis JCM 4913]|uniref:Putative response regulator n=1 Tax=Streptomyces davaonensis (strain DSM 101723 / JCM 4913 / KCC S-0913 / 768) TaxID=1214101 RepID=K4RAR0_STRDJ|nr:response regulator transcription factor [Streptomyces davaonensis]CCK30513.1 putative response regulator [Streptomyces davaonensis JCM 4913]